MRELSWTKIWRILKLLLFIINSNSIQLFTIFDYVLLPIVAVVFHYLLLLLLLLEILNFIYLLIYYYLASLILLISSVKLSWALLFSTSMYFNKYCIIAIPLQMFTIRNQYATNSFYIARLANHSVLLPNFACNARTYFVYSKFRARADNSLSQFPR